MRFHPEDLHALMQAAPREVEAHIRACGECRPEAPVHDHVRRVVCVASDSDLVSPSVARNSGEESLDAGGSVAGP